MSPMYCGVTPGRDEGTKDAWVLFRFVRRYMRYMCPVGYSASACICNRAAVHMHRAAVQYQQFT